MRMPVIHPWQIDLEGPVTDFSESIFAIGNGYLGIRGYSLQTAKTKPQEHAMFRAGFFEQVKPGITDMVQLPDVLGIHVKGYQPEETTQSLDLRKGLFTQCWKADGLHAVTERIASMADRTLICVRETLTAETDRTANVQAAMEEEVANLPVHDDQMAEETETVRLLETLSHTDRELHMRAVRSGREIRFIPTLLVNGQPVPDALIHLELRAGVPVTVEKRVRLGRPLPGMGTALAGLRHRAGRG